MLIGPPWLRCREVMAALELDINVSPGIVASQPLADETGGRRDGKDIPDGRKALDRAPAPCADTYAFRYLVNQATHRAHASLAASAL